MTTLELLNEIEKAPAFMGGSERYKSVAGSDVLYKQDIECIRKDLKVLEMLKELIIQNKDNHWYIDIQEIKEWLDED